MRADGVPAVQVFEALQTTLVSDKTRGEMPDVEHGNFRTFVTPGEVAIQFLLLRARDAPIATFGFCDQAKLLTGASRFIDDQWIHLHPLRALCGPKQDIHGKHPSHRRPKRRREAQHSRASVRRSCLKSAYETLSHVNP